MNLEEYFNFLRPDDIRIKGTRIGIETILFDYIEKGWSPEAIAQTYPTLTLEQVYATILYYIHNKDKVDEYMINWLTHGYKMRSQQRLNSSPISIRLSKLNKLNAERENLKVTNDPAISAG
ncbi:DUF433 domain-containing protein [Spirulina sp. 06S082]|uniref:DUF433 domain-containing protein n=1 Tax=Spirulina sp. 06S082 TaxID=3110248 RepID=UPI002B1FDE63|nr:DUF433 domain-containing protein [Spirulina sp. 06S082]MEA5468170.1 DUF433 domain-containing protein [Spirulina sp. 06S082]